MQNNEQREGEREREAKIETREAGSFEYLEVTRKKRQEKRSSAKVEIESFSSIEVGYQDLDHQGPERLKDRAK